MKESDVNAPMAQDATATIARSRSAGRVPELDGLRGIAILLVFCLHYISNSRNGEFGSLLYRFAALFRLGWSGVDLFFVLSGFLIGGILLDARDSPSYFRTFYLRRVHRILPIYYAWITVYAIIAYAGSKWLMPSQASVFVSTVPVVVYYFFLQNLIFSPLGIFGRYWISVVWSLAVEEQFYLASPPLVRFLSLRRLIQVLSGCVLIAPILRVLIYTHGANGPEAAYVLMPCRADGLAFGMLAAIAWRNPAAKLWLILRVKSLRLVFAVLLAGALVMLKWFPGIYSLLMAAFGFTWLAMLYVCLMLLALLDGRGVLGRIARLRLLREWGRVSYCIYLIHLGILWACHQVLLGSAPRINDWWGVLTTILAAGLTWGVAQLSWRYFEKPLVDKGHAYRYAPIGSCAPAGVQVQPSLET